MAEKQKENTCESYEIKIQGHLDTRWSEWFYGMTITHEPDGATTLCGPLPDQAVLYSILDRLRDMNLPLISVNKIVEHNLFAGPDCHTCPGGRCQGIQADRLEKPPEIAGFGNPAERTDRMGDIYDNEEKTA